MSSLSFIGYLMFHGVPLSQPLVCDNARVKRDARGLLVVCVAMGRVGGRERSGASPAHSPQGREDFPQWVRSGLRTGITDAFMY